jgi:CDP-glucose 4,6-dehydratase
MLRAIAAGLPVVIRNPQAIRPWQHVLEPLNGYMALAEHMWANGKEFSEGWNFGPNDDDAMPVEWIVNKMTSQWGEGASWKLDNRDQPHEAHYLKLDCSKAKSRLNWAPRWNIEQALEKIIAWHRAFISGKNMREFSLAQINEYEMSKVKRFS